MFSANEVSSKGSRFSAINDLHVAFCIPFSALLRPPVDCNAIYLIDFVVTALPLLAKTT